MQWLAWSAAWAPGLLALMVDNRSLPRRSGGAT
jgi:hypothetical protein